MSGKGPQRYDVAPSETFYPINHMPPNVGRADVQGRMPVHHDIRAQQTQTNEQPDSIQHPKNLSHGQKRQSSSDDNPRFDSSWNNCGQSPKRARLAVLPQQTLCQGDSQITARYQTNQDGKSAQTVAKDNKLDSDGSTIGDGKQQRSNITYTVNNRAGFRQIVASLPQQQNKQFLRTRQSPSANRHAHRRVVQGTPTPPRVTTTRSCATPLQHIQNSPQSSRSSTSSNHSYSLRETAQRQGRIGYHPDNPAAQEQRQSTTPPIKTKLPPTGSRQQTRIQGRPAGEASQADGQGANKAGDENQRRRNNRSGRPRNLKLRNHILGPCNRRNCMRDVCRDVSHTSEG